MTLKILLYYIFLNVRIGKWILIDWLRANPDHKITPRIWPYAELVVSLKMSTSLNQTCQTINVTKIGSETSTVFVSFFGRSAFSPKSHSTDLHKPDFMPEMNICKENNSELFLIVFHSFTWNWINHSDIKNMTSDFYWWVSSVDTIAETEQDVYGPKYNFLTRTSWKARVD